MQRGGGGRARDAEGVQDGGDGGEPWVTVPGLPRLRLSMPPRPLQAHGVGHVALGDPVTLAHGHDHRIHPALTPGATVFRAHHHQQ